jgi:hypothetical protein
MIVENRIAVHNFMALTLRNAALAIVGFLNAAKRSFNFYGCWRFVGFRWTHWDCHHRNQEFTRF